jgi:hypothetical protein
MLAITDARFLDGLVAQAERAPKGEDRACGSSHSASARKPRLDTARLAFSWHTPVCAS